MSAAMSTACHRAANAASEVRHRARRCPRALLAVLAVLAVVGAALALRALTLIAALADGSLGLHVDEAQYWVWSRELAWGYASKPPLIAALIAGATRLGGDSVLAIRSVGLLSYPLTGAVLATLAWQLARSGADGRLTGGGEGDSTLDAQRAARAARAAFWAALLFVASPLAGLLGLVTTTDAPLLLAWSAACALLWQALHARRRAAALAWWGALGVVAGLGLLAKYSFAAWLPGAAWVVVQAWRDQAGRAATRHQIAGLGLAAAALLMVVAPHLGWNAAEGWPAVRHTWEITWQGVASDGVADPTVDLAADPATASAGSRLHPVLTAIGRVLGVPLSLALLVGPLWLLCLPALAPALRASANRRATAFVLALHLPLLLIGLLQAGASAPQMNWLAPVVPGLVLLLALAMADVGPGAVTVDADASGRPMRPCAPLRAGIGLTLALHIAITLALPLAAPLHRTVHGLTSDAPLSNLPRQLDIWARMRGWQASFDALREPVRAQIARHPGIEVVTASRSVIAQGRHAWRDLPIGWRAWKPPGPPAHHFERVAPWPPADDALPSDRRPRPVLLVLDRAPSAALRQRLEGLVCLAVSGREPSLSLWLGWTAADGRRPVPKADGNCPREGLS